MLLRTCFLARVNLISSSSFAFFYLILTTAHPFQVSFSKDIANALRLSSRTKLLEALEGMQRLNLWGLQLGETTENVSLMTEVLASRHVQLTELNLGGNNLGTFDIIKVFLADVYFSSYL